MDIKLKYLKGFITFLLLGLLLFGVAGTAHAFDLRGYSYNETGSALNNTNITIEVYQMGGGGPPTPVAGTPKFAASNETGYFNVSGIPADQSYFYKIILKHFNGTLDYVGQSLPMFPYQETAGLAQGTPINFYMRKGGTINITAVNETQSQSFRYQVKDTRLGYQVAENFNQEVTSATLYVPLERNYSIMIYPNQSFPVSYDLNNLTDWPNDIANITFNTSNTLRKVSGYAKYNNLANFDDLKTIAYLMEPGNMVFQDYPLPYNMSGWCQWGPSPCAVDSYDPATGFYNITLPGAKMNANILIFATARIGSDYYGAFRNVSLDYSNDPVTGFNFTLQQLLGTQTNITVNNASDGSQFNITTRKLAFQLKNQSSGQNLTGNAFVEVQVNYSGVGASFKWTVDVDQANNGSFTVPALNADIRRINVFTQGSAPLKTSKTASQLASLPVLINLTSFNPGAINESESIPDIMMDMLISMPACDIPNPAAGCSLIPAANGQNLSDFNPFKVVIGGGKLSMRIKKASNNITVHYKNVDMLASGPPDALFDSSGNASSSSVEEAFRFGSKGPEIYDRVLIGMPYNSSVFSDSYNFKMKINKLYNESWGVVWQTSDGVANIPSDYSEYAQEPYVGYMGSTGLACSKTDQTATCYVDTAANIVWMWIPHFSGVGPTIVGAASTTTPSSSGGSGGSSGGGGVTTAEPYDNIAKAESSERTLIANALVTYVFTAPEHGIYQITVTGKESEYDITIRVEALKGASRLVKNASAPGTVYKHVNIWAGTKNIKEAVIKFKVENSWLESNSFAGSNIKLVRWDGSKWNQLETAEKNRDGVFTYYEAKTDSFPSFAIVGVKASAESTAQSGESGKVTPYMPAVPNNTPTSAPAGKTTGFELMLALVTLYIVYLFGQRRR